MMARIATVTINSTRVKPDWLRLRDAYCIQGPYCTCTAVCEPVMLTACCALFFAEARTTAMFASPATLAWKVRIQTVPDPLTPGTPGGREAEITTFPAPSSR